MVSDFHYNNIHIYRSALCSLYAMDNGFSPKPNNWKLVVGIEVALLDLWQRNVLFRDNDEKFLLMVGTIWLGAIQFFIKRLYDIVTALIYIDFYEIDDLGKKLFHQRFKEINYYQTS